MATDLVPATLRNAPGASPTCGTAAMVYGDRVECLLCGKNDHWTNSCPNASKPAAAEDAAAADTGLLHAADAAGSGSVVDKEEGSIASGAAPASTTGAAAASPRSSRSNAEDEEEEEEEHLYDDAASSLGGSFCHAVASDGPKQEGAAAAAAEAEAIEEPMSPQPAAGKDFVANVRGDVVTSGPTDAAPALAASAADEDAFSGAALGGSYASTAASSVSNVELVAAQVPAQYTAESQVPL